MANYVLNMGGDSGSGYSNIVDVFKVTINSVEKVIDHNLTLSVARADLSATANGNYILAMGGYNILNDNPNYLDTVDVFHVTGNGVETVTGHGLTLSEARAGAATASCGNYILAMGGYNDSGYTNTVDVFRVTENGVEVVTDHNLTLSVARQNLAAAACGEYILAMGGGANALSFNDTIDVFKVTANGVEHITDHGLSLSVARYNLAAAACGNYILAMGGSGSSGNSNTVDVFHVTENGIEAVTGHGLTLSEGRYQLAAASCGNYILAMGGRVSNIVDVFQIIFN